MAISALSAAKYLAETSEWSLTNLAIQKLVYIAHMVHVGRFDKKLIAEPIEAWAYGPVIPEIYHALKGFGADPVKNIFRRIPPIEKDSSYANVLEAVYNEFGNVPASKLVSVTHRPTGAWHAVYKANRQGVIIPTRKIKEEYKALAV